MLAVVGSLQDQINEKTIVLGLSFILSLFTLSVAWWNGFFKSFEFTRQPQQFQINGRNVLFGFAIFLFSEIAFVPSLIGIFFYFLNIDYSNEIYHYPQIQGWINLLIILGGFLGIVIAYLQLTPLQKEQLWHQKNQYWLSNIGIGITAWFISYPIVLAFGQALSLILWQLFRQPFIEQIAVQNIREMISNPLLFGFTAISVITIVPLTEEFLFRGLLQSWLKSVLHHRTLAIIISSIIFAFFHFSKMHGFSNIELLSSLFLLSCMLGYLFERQGSLWASIGLHGFFNLMSLIMISLT